MAKRRRKNKQGGTGGELLVKAFVSLFTILVLVGSFLLFFAWWFFESKAKHLKKVTSIHDFDHTEEEINKIKRYEAELEQYYQRLDYIAYEGKSLSTRQDGMYDERSKKGKQFNAEINDLRPRAEIIEQSVADLEALPEKRLNHWAFYASMNWASRYSVLSYIFSFFLFTWLQPVWVMELSEIMQNLSFLDFYASYPIAYGASVGSLLSALSVLSLSFVYIRAEKKDALIHSSELI